MPMPMVFFYSVLAYASSVLIVAVQTVSSRGNSRGPKNMTLLLDSDYLYLREALVVVLAGSRPRSQAPARQPVQGQDNGYVTAMMQGKP